MAEKTKITVEASAYIALSCYLLLMPVGWVANALAAMAVHELGHCAAIWACGRTVYEIRIGAYGAKIITQTADHSETLICALAGPAAGMLLALFYRWVPVAALCALLVFEVEAAVEVHVAEGGTEGTLGIVVGGWGAEAVE